LYGLPALDSAVVIGSLRSFLQESYVLCFSARPYGERRFMKFVDEVSIRVKAGDGGNGCMSFRREKFIENGGPTAVTAVTAARST
jgi:hypothetical protein